MKDLVLSRVLEQRTKSNVTQQELADAVGVTRQTIFAIEKGRYTPSVSLALKIASYFQKLGARKVTLTTKEDVLKAHVKKIDFIFISDYSEKREYGKAGFFDFKKLSKVNPDLGIVHLFGKLNHKEISNYLPVVYPAFNGNSSVMTFTLAHVGINPFINLQVAGFKVGELILSGKESSLKQIIVGD